MLVPTPTGALLYVNLGGPAAQENLLVPLGPDAHATGVTDTEMRPGDLLVPRDSSGLLMIRAGTATPLDFSGVPTGPAHPVLLAPAPQRSLSTASDGARLVSVWITKTAAGDRVEGAVLHSVDEEPACFTLSQSTETIKGVAVAASPAGFLAAWIESGALRAALLVGDTWIPLDTGIETEGEATLMDVAWAGEFFVVAWTDGCRWTREEGFDCDLRVADVSPAGLVTDRGSWHRGEYRTVSIVPRTVGGSGVAVGFVAVEDVEPGWEAPPRVTTLLLGNDPWGAPRSMQLFSPVWLSEVTPQYPDADAAWNGETTIALVTDGRDVEAVVVNSYGFGGPSERRKIASGQNVVAVAIAPATGGFAAAWIVREERPGRIAHRLFLASLDEAGKLSEPILSIATNQVPSGWDLAELDLAALGGDLLATLVTEETSDPTRLPANRAEGIFASALEIHPGPPAAPASASLASFAESVWEVQWTPVAGADEYLVEALGKQSPWPYSNHPSWRRVGTARADQSRLSWLHSDTPVRVRIYAIREGLLSEPLVVELPRHRMVTR
jgi:hypothetical protein